MSRASAGPSTSCRYPISRRTLPVEPCCGPMTTCSPSKRTSSNPLRPNTVPRPSATKVRSTTVGRTADAAASSGMPPTADRAARGPGRAGRRRRHRVVHLTIHRRSRSRPLISPVTRPLRSWSRRPSDDHRQRSISTAIPATRSESDSAERWSHVLQLTENLLLPGTARTMGEGLMQLRLFGGLTPEGWRRVTENWECSA